MAVLLASFLLAGVGTAQPVEKPGGGLEDVAEHAARHRGYPVVPVERLRGRGLQDVSVDGRRLDARLADGRLEVVDGSPFYHLGGEVRQLANPPYWRDGEVWVPVELLQALRDPGSEARDGAAALPGRGDGARPAPSGPWRVTIDPGHGGRDPGARGPRGTREKDVVLAIAKRLRDRLERAPNVDVAMTRETDRFIPLAERSQMALEDSAHLFVSIHANANRSRRPRGFETYFLSPARTEEARRVAMRENSAIQYEEESQQPQVSDLNYIWAAIDQNTNVQESSYFAGRVQNAMRTKIESPDRGVKQAGFYVLMGAGGSMPAVLVETGFISNPRGERYLDSTGGQREIAAALADAIVGYFRQREGRLAEASP